MTGSPSMIAMRRGLPEYGSMGTPSIPAALTTAGEVGRGFFDRLFQSLSTTRHCAALEPRTARAWVMASPSPYSSRMAATLA